MSNDSTLLRQERCPVCAAEGKDRSGNNLAVYSDGHSFCFGGHGLVSGGSKVLQFLKSPDVEWEKHKVVLPADCDTQYPERCLKWVGQYELTKNDLLSNNVLWSDENQRLIFPIYDSEEGLIAWQGRWFGEGQHVKWFGRGSLKHTYNILGRGSTLILTEDVVSAIKVANCGVMAMPLYGCVVGTERFQRLRYLFKPNQEIRVWLDPDKRKEAIKEARIGGRYGFKTSSILSENDPKEHSYEEIREILNEQPYC